MNLKNGYPYWLILNGLPHQYPRLLTQRSADVVIIGGGISGALAAYHLTQKGVSCILLDRRTVGLGSTCASTSLVQYELDKPLCELSEQIGKASAGRVYSRCASAIEELAALCKKIKFKEAERVPSLYFSAGKADEKLVEREYKARKTLGLEVALLNQQEIRQAYGFSAGKAIESAQGIAMDVYLFSHALCRAALNKGLEIYDRTAVTKIEEHARSLTVHTEHGAKLRCHYVVNASGYEAGQFLKGKKLVTFKSTYAMVSEHMDEGVSTWKNRAMLWNTADPYLYVRLTSDNRIIVGGRDEPVYRDTGRDKLVLRKSSLLAGDFNRLFPHIELRPEFSWAGTFGVSKDSMPYIGAVPQHPRIYHALGYGGNGILFSHIAAGVITDAICGVKNKAAELFHFNR